MDPTTRAWRRQQANRRAAEGWAPALRAAVGGLIVLALLVPLVNRVFLAWVRGPADFAPFAMEGLLLRADIVVIGWLAIDVYSALIRGGDRAVLAIWPVDPAGVVRFELVRLARARLFLIAGWAVLSAPVALASPALWALGVVQVACAWVLALVASAMVILLAVDVSEDERAAPLLDLVRGNNHRAQAAFLYAPGIVLVAVGAIVNGAAVGVRRLVEGDPLGALLMAIPLVVAGLAWIPVPSLARRSWFEAGTVMAEVDARYALIEEREEALRVYLDWAVRFLPADVRRYALKDLRHGWRARRTWIMGAWLVGLAALVATWTKDPIGPVRAASIAVMGCWIVASVGVLLEADEPEFLKSWLPPGGAAKWVGRAVVLGLWQQPAVWLGAVAAVFRQGLGAGGLVLGVGEVSIALAAIASVGCGLRGGLPLYGPVAAAASAVVVIGVLG
ncbi:MAG: hypothetical protein H6737_27685 [Alphaproteobacteria bacterium]|nr:hypothetical protein [Alphaproteobacteria bacterium]